MFQNGSVHSFNDIPTLLYAACQYLGYYSYVKKNMNYVDGMFFKVIPDGLHQVRNVKNEGNLPASASAQINAVGGVTICIDVE